ncbi:NAD(P)/FAD-dependent oxidoreductase [Pseudonocardia nantongensis]|uniref:NAD(P)/FAD-dependent oxidoreductase n=1 Tax=Pseudonocardia nantongensis TaxID=1181885 RepID=UPI00397B68B2
MSTHTAPVGLLVVGGGPAAHSAAIAYREQGGEGSVLVVSDDDTPPYFRPALTKDHLRGESSEAELLLAPDRPDGVEIRTGRTVGTLSPAEYRARLDDGTTIDYRQCVLATGATPTQLPVPGAENGLYLRYLADARTLHERIGPARSVVVVGSGFIGCEAAVSMVRRGLEVTVCSNERNPQATRLGDAVGDRLAEWLRAEGVRFRSGAEVTGIESTTDRQVVHVRDGDPAGADVVLVAAGITPRAGLAAEAGVPVEQDRVVVDEHMRSTVDGVLAAGDVALARNAAAGRHLAVEHWGEAEAMGRIAGTTAAGGDAVWDSPPGFWTEIGDRVLKYAAWGDGFDEVALATHGDGGFTAWYQRAGLLVGVATHLADDDFERGADLVRRNATSSAGPGTPDTTSPVDVPG